MAEKSGSNVTPCPPADWQRICAKFDSRKKIEKSLKPLLTLREAPDYIRLINEGGAPLATPKFASTNALDEITRAA